MCKYFKELNWEKLTEDELYAKSFYFLTECGNCNAKFSCSQDKGMITRIGLAAITAFDEYSFDELLEQAEDLKDLKIELSEAELRDDLEEYGRIDYKEMTREELKDALKYMHSELTDAYNNVINKEKAIKEISQYISDYVKRDMKNVELDFVLTDELESRTAGQYYETHRLAAMNINFLDKALSGNKYNKMLRVIDSYYHEARHAWQWDEWWDFSDYVDGNDDYNNYYNHPTEVDAREFAFNKVHSLKDKLISIYADLINLARSID